MIVKTATNKHADFHFSNCNKKQYCWLENNSGPTRSGQALSYLGNVPGTCFIAHIEHIESLPEVTANIYDQFCFTAALKYYES